MRRAQTEVITLLLVSGIVITLVGTAYFWGKPLIEKRAAANDFTLFQKFAEDIDAKISAVANSKSGSETLRIPGGSVRVIPMDTQSPDNNSIIIEFPLSQKLVLGDAEVYFRTSSTGLLGTFGQDEPRIITFQQAAGTFRMKIYYRELELSQPRKAFRIALNPGSGQSSGSTELTIRYGGISAATATNGGPLSLTTIIVTPV